MGFHPAFSTPHVWESCPSVGAPHAAPESIVCVVCGAEYPKHPDGAHAPVWALPDLTEPSVAQYAAREG